MKTILQKLERGEISATQAEEYFTKQIARIKHLRDNPPYKSDRDFEAYARQGWVGGIDTVLVVLGEDLK